MAEGKVDKHKSHIVLYCYYELDDIRIKNLQFFIDHGIVEGDYLYVIIVNGEKLSLKIKNTDNLIIIHRPNIHADFGGWAEGLRYLKTNTYTADYYIFLNDSCRGPFIPRYIPSSVTWLQMFSSPINDKVKISGCTCNYVDYNRNYNPHIQSYAFCLDNISLDIAIDGGIFNPKKYDFRYIYINNHEVRMTTLLLLAGYDFYAFQMSEYSPHDQYLKNKNIPHEDIQHGPGTYFGIDIHPLEVMFMKTNRGYTIVTDQYTEWCK